MDAGLLDEVSMLYAPAIDGRKDEPAAYDNLPKERELILSIKLDTFFENHAADCNSS